MVFSTRLLLVPVIEQRTGTCPCLCEQTELQWSLTQTQVWGVCRGQCGAERGFGRASEHDPAPSPSRVPTLSAGSRRLVSAETGRRREEEEEDDDVAAEVTTEHRF
ncbi:hypothetical protein NL108_001048 [Boleophthalmus pectinirostris]|nr:hypothetical protein NL108_001048 [Boleophthalmus pectinirostris]